VDDNQVHLPLLCSQIQFQTLMVYDEIIRISNQEKIQTLFIKVVFKLQHSGGRFIA
jgi:hypothetical protein